MISPSRRPLTFLLFVSGDSYTQTGFDPLSTLPNSANPFGNPPYPGWTSASGANWVGYVTTAYNRSLLYTYNYAYGGATINATLVAPYQSTVLSLGDQVNQFLTGAGKKPPATPWTSQNSLFSVWIGINDIGNSWWKEGDRAAQVPFTMEASMTHRLSQVFRCSPRQLFRFDREDLRCWRTQLPFRQRTPYPEVSRGSSL